MENSPPRQFEPDPVDPGHRRLVGGDDAAGEVDPDRRRVAPRQGPWMDPAVEGDDQVADLRALGGGKGGDDGRCRDDGEESEEGRVASEPLHTRLPSAGGGATDTSAVLPIRLPRFNFKDPVTGTCPVQTTASGALLRYVSVLI